MKTFAPFLAALLILAASDAFAVTHLLPPSLAPETLSESVPTAFAPDSFSVDDYALEWLGNPVPGVEISLGKKSLEWVRVAEVLVLPRARLLLRAQGYATGTVASAGFTQAFAEDGTAELPIAMMSGERNPIELKLRRGTETVRGTLVVRFKPRKKSDELRIYTDPSCSSYRVKVVSAWLPDDSWAIVGCRLVQVEGSEHRSSSLEAFVYWDNIGQSVKMNGIDTPSTSVSTWPLRLRPQPGEFELAHEKARMELSYSIPERFHWASLALGIGPYHYDFDAPGENEKHLTAVPTLYGSFFITETLRFVSFAAVSISPAYTFDAGVYVHSEYLRIVDRRVQANIMLGGNVKGFKVNGAHRTKTGFPQGIELQYKDALMKGRNFAIGAFIYPLINERAYYNVWTRWGSSALFYEFNYIAWQEPLENDTRAYSRSVGFSMGFPVARFF